MSNPIPQQLHELGAPVSKKHPFERKPFYKMARRLDNLERVFLTYCESSGVGRDAARQQAVKGWLQIYGEVNDMLAGKAPVTLGLVAAQPVFHNSMNEILREGGRLLKEDIESDEASEYKALTINLDEVEGMIDALYQLVATKHAETEPARQRHGW